MNIKKAIKAHNSSVKEVAEKIGVHPITLSTTINGNPTLQTMERIAQAIGCDVAEFFTDGAQQCVCPHCGRPLTIRIE